MAIGSSDRNLIIGFLLGAGAGLATALLLDPSLRARLRSLFVEGAGEVADRMATLGKGPATWHDRKAERAGRTFQRQIDQMRSAGF